MFANSKHRLDNTAKCCAIMAVLHITDYDVRPRPMTLTTNVATACKNEKYPKQYDEKYTTNKNFNLDTRSALLHHSDATLRQNI